MNQRIDLTNLGGYPLAQEDLDFLQQSYRGAFAGMANMFGDKVILSGMVEGGGNVTAGWIAIGGELLPFVAGAIGTGEFIIDETTQALTFQDGNTRNVLITRVARFSAGGIYLYSDLVRIGLIKEMWQAGDLKDVKCDAPYIAANFNGTGLGINKRVGWAICNGQNGTPDLRGKFKVSYSDTDGDFDIGDTGGAKEVTLTGDKQGRLRIAAKIDDVGGGAATVVAKIRFGNPGVEVPMNGGANQSTYGSDILANLEDATQAHENLPPFEAVLTIMKL